MNQDRPTQDVDVLVVLDFARSRQKGGIENLKGPGGLGRRRPKEL